MLSLAPLVSYRPLAQGTRGVLPPPILRQTRQYASVSRQAWSQKRAPTEDLHRRIASGERTRVWHSPSRNCIAAVVPRSEHWGPPRPRCRRVVAKTDRCRKN